MPPINIKSFLSCFATKNFICIDNLVVLGEFEKNSLNPVVITTLALYFFGKLFDELLLL